MFPDNLTRTERSCYRCYPRCIRKLLQASKYYCYTNYSSIEQSESFSLINSSPFFHSHQKLLTNLNLIARRCSGWCYTGRRYGRRKWCNERIRSASKQTPRCEETIAKQDNTKSRSSIWNRLMVQTNYSHGFAAINGGCSCSCSCSCVWCMFDDRKNLIIIH